jgi:hypothetical protein
MKKILTMLLVLTGLSFTATAQRQLPLKPAMQKNRVTRLNREKRIKKRLFPGRLRNQTQDRINYEAIPVDTLRRK